MNTPSPSPPTPTLDRKLLTLMAVSTGVCVANLYYNQPLLDQMQESFHVSLAQLGWIPTLTQVGYAVGILLMVPLGDMYERKKLIVGVTFSSVICAALVAWAPSFLAEAFLSLLLGIATITPQLIIPYAAHLASPAERGKVVGTMMSGLLLGILLARTVSGFIGAAYGWRAMFFIAAFVLFILTIAQIILLPRCESTFKGTYSELLKSMFYLVRDEPILREAALFGALLFGAFSAFWATLIHLMNSPAFHLGARAVGLFGLLGAAAAGVTPWIGARADRKDPRNTTGIMIAITFFSFLIFMASSQSLWGLSLGVLVMDIGVQSGHVSNQSRVFALTPEARSRLNTVYMFTYFTGGAAGSLLGSWCWSQYAWVGVCGSALFMLSVSGILFYFGPDRPRASL